MPQSSFAFGKSFGKSSKNNSTSVSRTLKIMVLEKASGENQYQSDVVAYDLNNGIEH